MAAWPSFPPPSKLAAMLMVRAEHVLMSKFGPGDQIIALLGSAASWSLASTTDHCPLTASGEPASMTKLAEAQQFATRSTANRCRRPACMLLAATVRVKVLTRIAHHATGPLPICNDHGT